MSLPTVSIVIPSQNMFMSLLRLLKSLEKTEVLSLVNEVIVINDGSTDRTAEELERLRQLNPWTEKLKIHSLPEARGRFEARQWGARLARSELVFFIDSRVSLRPGTAATLRDLCTEHRHLMGMTFIDTTQSLFNLYWERSHQWIFRKHYQDVAQGFYLNPENYEDYAKGTGLLILPREEFLHACENLGPGEVLADDTLLLHKLVQAHPLYVTGRFSFAWEPRQNLPDFLWRLFDRGPGFVQYHFLEQQTRFFAATLAAFLFAILGMAASWFALQSLWPGLLILLLLGSGSVLLITRRPLEVLRLAPLHTLVLASFTAGVFYGLAYCLWRKNKMAGNK